MIGRTDGAGTDGAGVDGVGADGPGTGGRDVRFRPGDVVRLECPFTWTTVADVSRFHVSVRWPWSEVDPQAENFGWNGRRALPLPEAHEWELFRTRPPETGLKPDDTCRVGIPPTVVYVLTVHHFDPPRVTGRLPRPATYLEILRQGETHDLEFEDQGYAFDPAGDEPIRFELLFRPYAFLEPGDEVTDRNGRAWRFDAAWDWHPLDGAGPGIPAWPLTLLSRGDGPTPEEAVAVARATATGGHAEEVERWTALTGASPVPQQW